MSLRRTEPRTVVREFGPVWLWRDDIAKIVETMREVSPELTLQSDAFMLDEVDDLRDLEENSIDTFRATSVDSRIRLSLGPKEAFISADEPDLATRGMLEEVYKIAKSQDRPGFRKKAFIAGASFWFLGFMALLLKYGHGQSYALSFFAFAGILGLPIWFQIQSSPRRKAILGSRTRTEAPLWLTRNRDALVTNAIISAAFLIIGILIGLLLPRS
jgi:hypothetical protein